MALTRGPLPQFGERVDPWRVVGCLLVVPFQLFWSTSFEDPIVLPNGRQLLMLKDATDYITKLPKKESALPEWQTAIEVLMRCSRGGGGFSVERLSELLDDLPLVAGVFLSGLLGLFDARWLLFRLILGSLFLSHASLKPSLRTVHRSLDFVGKPI
jgi:hypothetical protein